MSNAQYSCSQGYQCLCSSPSKSKYPAISSPSEAVSASIHMIDTHDRYTVDQACIYGLGKGGGGEHN